MQRYKVRWTAAAAHDLECIPDYIAGDSHEQALSILKQIKAKAATLYTVPDRGRIIPELKIYGITTYRELIITPWRLIYRTADRTVSIYAVIDSRRNLEDILLDRLIR